MKLQVPFDFIGRRAAIENAKMMMEYHLDHLKEVENILQSRREMDNQLTHGYAGDTYFPRPSDRGSRRGGRGGRGGRGRLRTSSRWLVCTLAHSITLHHYVGASW